MYDFNRKTARAQLAEVFRADNEDKPEAKHVEDVDEGDEKVPAHVEIK